MFAYQVLREEQVHRVEVVVEHLVHAGDYLVRDRLQQPGHLDVLSDLPQDGQGGVRQDGRLVVVLLLLVLVDERPEKKNFP